MSHIFAPASVRAFEPHTKHHIGTLMREWDQLCEGGLKGLSGEKGGQWQGRDGWVFFDCLTWYNYLAFAIIGASATKFAMFVS